MGTDWLIQEGKHPMLLPIGTPSEYYYSMSSEEWMPISSVVKDFHHAVSARNFLIDVLINCQHMVWANQKLKKNGLAGLETLIIGGLTNIQLGLTFAINDWKVDRRRPYFKEEAGKGYEVKWHYHNFSPKDGEKMTAEQQKAYKRGQCTRFFVQEAKRVTEYQSLNTPQNERVR